MALGRATRRVGCPPWRPATRAWTLTARALLPPKSRRAGRSFARCSAALQRRKRRSGAQTAPQSFPRLSHALPSNNFESVLEKKKKKESCACAAGGSHRRRVRATHPNQKQNPKSKSATLRLHRRRLQATTSERCRSPRGGGGDEAAAAAA